MTFYSRALTLIHVRRKLRATLQFHCAICTRRTLPDLCCICAACCNLIRLYSKIAQSVAGLILYSRRRYSTSTVSPFMQSAHSASPSCSTVGPLGHRELSPAYIYHVEILLCPFSSYILPFFLNYIHFFSCFIRSIDFQLNFRNNEVKFAVAQRCLFAYSNNTTHSVAFSSSKLFMGTSNPNLNTSNSPAPTSASPTNTHQPNIPLARMNTQLALYVLDLSNSGQKLFSCLLHPKIVSEKVSGKKYGSFECGNPQVNKDSILVLHEKTHLKIKRIMRLSWR